MYPDAPTLDGQLLRIADVFFKILAPEACRRRIGLYALAILMRVKRFERRFCALHALWRSGRLPKVRARKDTTPRPSPQSGEGACGAVPRSPVKGEGEEVFDPMAPGGVSWVMARERPASVLPRTFRWMQRMLPASNAALAGGVDSLMRNFPEMQAFAAECPQVGRLLRPICRMVGIVPPEYLALPRRRRASPPPQPIGSSPVASLCSPVKGEGEGDTSPRPSPRRGEGEEYAPRRKRRSPREVAAAAMEWSHRTGKPIDPRKIGAVAFGYVLHWPRDGNCPPPEIGYGGRMFPPLPKDYVRPKDWDEEG